MLNQIEITKLDDIDSVTYLYVLKYQTDFFGWLLYFYQLLLHMKYVLININDMRVIQQFFQLKQIIEIGSTDIVL